MLYSINLSTEAVAEGKDEDEALRNFVDKISTTKWDFTGWETTMREIDEQLCCECGESVKAGSGRFVNRVGVFDNYETRKEQGRAYPLGSFVCAECDSKLRD